MHSEKFYLYKDHGTDAFSGDFEHYCDVRPISSSNTGHISTVWAISNNIGGWYNMAEQLSAYIQVSTSPLPVFGVLVKLGGSIYTSSSSYTGVWNTTYYLTVSRIGTALTCKIYSDSSTTNLLHTATRTGVPTNSYRYVYAYQNQGEGAAGFTLNVNVYNHKYLNFGTISGNTTTSGIVYVHKASDMTLIKSQSISTGNYSITDTGKIPVNIVLVPENEDKNLIGYKNVIPD